MESIDKLRDWARHVTESDPDENIVSPEYVAQECGRMALRFADEIEREVADRYIALPLDADGVPIHLGDLLYRGDGDMHYCHGIGKPSLDIMDEHLTWWRSECFRHAKPRTLEDVLADFAARVLNSGHQWGLDAQEATAECAAEIRKLTEVGR